MEHYQILVKYEGETKEGFFRDEQDARWFYHKIVNPIKYMEYCEGDWDITLSHWVSRKGWQQVEHYERIG